MLEALTETPKGRCWMGKRVSEYGALQNFGPALDILESRVYRQCPKPRERISLHKESNKTGAEESLGRSNIFEGRTKKGRSAEEGMTITRRKGGEFGIPKSQAKCFKEGVAEFSQMLRQD